MAIPLPSISTPAPKRDNTASSPGRACQKICAPIIADKTADVERSPTKASTPPPSFKPRGSLSLPRVYCASAEPPARSRPPLLRRRRPSRRHTSSAGCCTLLRRFLFIAGQFSDQQKQPQRPEHHKTEENQQPGKNLAFRLLFPTWGIVRRVVSVVIAAHCFGPPFFRCNFCLLPCSSTI